MTFAMCWGFLISWMPYAVVSMMAAYGASSILPIRAVLVSVLLAKSSTWVNPVIYFLLNKKFRPMFIRTVYARHLYRSTVTIEVNGQADKTSDTRSQEILSECKSSPRPSIPLVTISSDLSEVPDVML